MDNNVPIHTAEDLKNLFKELPSWLESCRKKKSLVKSGRWFSWHGACQEHLNEFWALRMILKHAFPDAQDPNENLSFKELRMDAGGLKLALKCCTLQTFVSINVLMLGGRPMWKWWAETIKRVKSPCDALRNYISLTTASAWRSDTHLQEPVACLQCSQEIAHVSKYCLALQSSTDDYVLQLWFYIVGLLSNRVATLCKFECAPYCFAPIFSDVDHHSAAAGEMMLADWKALCLIEQAAGAQELAIDLQNCVYSPMRLSFLLLETGERTASLEILRSMLQSFPDTKLVEDCHQKIRCDSLQNPNQRHSTAEIQHILVTSKVLEARNISHPASLTKRAFMSRFKTTKPPMKKQLKYHAANEKLPEFFGRIMAAKNWPTISAESLCRSSGAWLWGRQYLQKSLKDSGVVLKEPWMNQLSIWDLIFCGAEIAVTLTQ